MSFVLKNLEQTLLKLDTIIIIVSTTNECDCGASRRHRLNLFLKEVITDLDMAIAKIKENSPTQKFTK